MITSKRALLWTLCATAFSTTAVGCLDVPEVEREGADGTDSDCSACHHASHADGKEFDETECGRCHHAEVDVEGFEHGQPCGKCHHNSEAGASSPEAGKDCSACHHMSGDFSSGIEAGKDCSDCHHLGDDFTGGIESGKECSDCHHLGDDFSGGIEAGKDCADCHHREETQTKSCDGCHAYPPTTGAHTAHVADYAIECDACHPVPETWFDGSHLDAIIDVVFPADGLASADGASPTFDGQTCSGVYCHGATFEDVKEDPTWEGTVACGDCHERPPASHQSGWTNCTGCHSGAYTDGNLDPEKHVNGSVNFGS